MGATGPHPQGPHTQGAQAAETAGLHSEEEKRSAPRFPAAQVTSITGIRISPHGATASLVNISSSGVLADCGVRLKPGSTVSLQFEGEFSPGTVRGRVARSSVARVTTTGALRYHVAIAFVTAIVLPVAHRRGTTEAVVEAAEALEASLRNRW